MIDSNLLLLAEVGVFAVLVAVGIWLIAKRRKPAVLIPLIPAAHDMRQFGQQPVLAADRR